MLLFPRIFPGFCHEIAKKFQIFVFLQFFRRFIDFITGEVTF